MTHQESTSFRRFASLSAIRFSHDVADAAVANNAPDHILVRDVADNEFDTGWHGLAPTGGEVVQYDDRPIAFTQREHGVALDIPRRRRSRAQACGMETCVRPRHDEHYDRLSLKHCVVRRVAPSDQRAPV